jgi:alpha-methylacyl-CoA racemase
MERAQWPRMRERVAAAFLTRPQADWTARFAAVDSCGAPVLTTEELAADPHIAARRSISASDTGALTAAPAPRLSAHPELTTDIRPRQKQDAKAALMEAGFSDEEIDSLIEQEIVWSL